MSRRRLALATHSPSQHAGKNAGRRNRRQPREIAARPQPPVWTEVEQAFFAAAPPDEPEPAAQPESFEDLGAVARDGSRLRRAWAHLRAAFRRLFVRPHKSVPHRP